jgi:enoyl-CoA hydratase/carnithine racemase
VSDYHLAVDVDDDHVATVEFGREPNNYFDLPLIGAIADAFEALAADGTARAVVLCSTGRHFCAGADLRAGPEGADGAAAGPGQDAHLYDAAVRLFAQPLPIVAAVQGGAIGGGLGLALAADLRVASPDTRFAAPFARLGLHHGFGLTVTLPLVVGHQRSIELLYTGRRVKGDEAFALGLCDRLVPTADLRAEAGALAAEIAASAPIAVRSIRATMRGHLAEAVRAATDHETAEQAIHRQTADMAEGVRADRERRRPSFTGT